LIPGSTSFDHLVDGRGWASWAPRGAGAGICPGKTLVEPGYASPGVPPALSSPHRLPFGQLSSAGMRQ
jgi:hypothetical protein